MKFSFLCKSCTTEPVRIKQEEKYLQTIKALKTKLSLQHKKQFDLTVEMNRIKGLVDDQKDELVDLLHVVDTMGHEKGNEGYRIQIMNRLKNMYVYSKMVEEENYSLY